HRHKEELGVLDGRREEAGVPSFRKVFEPAGGVDEVQTRSFSRLTAVSIPRMNPRSERAVFSGTNSIRSPKAMTFIFAHGVMPCDCRTARGMTTWNFGDTVTVVMALGIDKYFVLRSYHRYAIRTTPTMLGL